MSQTLDNLTVQTRPGPDATRHVLFRSSAVPEPVSATDLVVEMLAAPINPTDIVTLLGSSDPASARRLPGDRGGTELDLPDGTTTFASQDAVGSEGAGRVVAAGDDDRAQALVGQVVAVLGPGTYSRYLTTTSDRVLTFRRDVDARDVAASYINPLTALGMVETMRREGFRGLVHTAAASNLGRMVNRLCIAEDIPLVNIVRRPEQVELLRGEGAAQVVDSSSATYTDDLVASLRATGATLAFDAIGGGRAANDILTAMDSAAILEGASFPHGHQYGTVVPKKVYVYGGLAEGPLVLERAFGTAWSVSGWLLWPFLDTIGPARADELKRRVSEGIDTVFASAYTETIAFADMLEPDVMQSYARRATGEKYLVDLSDQ